MSSTNALPAVTTPDGPGLPHTDPYTAPLAREAYAPWLRRVVAVLLDFGLLGGIAWLAVGESGVAPSLWAGLFSHPPGVPGWPVAGPQDVVGWPAAGAALALLALQAWTGWTPGKLVAGIAVVRQADGAPAGFLRTVWRLVAHLVDSILLIGYLRPLWQREGRTFADSLAGTVVVLRRPSLPHRPGQALTGATLAVCLVLGGLSVTWQGFGGTRAMGSAQCLPADPADGDRTVSAYASAEVRGEEIAEEVQRLWMRRTTSQTVRYSVTWTWSPTTVPTGDLAVETTVSAPGGEGPAFTERMGVAGRSSEVNQIELEPDDGTGLDRVTVYAGDLGGAARDGITRLGRTADVTSALLLDGEPVATCTVEGLTLEPLDRPR